MSPTPEPHPARPSAPMPAAAVPPPRQVIAARTAVAFVFALNGLAVASWFSRVPAAREGLGLSAGRLGLLLLAMSLGAILAMVTAGARGAPGRIRPVRWPAPPRSSRSGWWWSASASARGPRSRSWPSVSPRSATAPASPTSR